MKKYILGTVPFLNSRPLVYPLENNLIDSNIEIQYYVPSHLSEKLNSREVDMGLIPVAELLKNPGYKIFPGISISSYGAVDSVILLSTGELDEIESVAVDKRSRSSTALLKIILEKFHSLSPRYIEKQPGDQFLEGVDAGMLIGDDGLHAKYNIPDGYTAYDLGELWTEFTGLPFVYAVFAHYSDNDPGPNAEMIVKSKSLGLELIDDIVNEEYLRSGLEKDTCLNYLTRCIKYDLGIKEIEAINRFGNYMIEYDKDLNHLINNVNIVLPDQQRFNS